MENKELQALLRLIDDADPDVFGVVEGKLVELGIDYVPELEIAWASDKSVLFTQRLEDIIHKIQLNNTFKSLKKWHDTGCSSLFEVLFIIAQYQYPELPKEVILQKYQAIKQDIWLELNDNLTALERIKVMNHILFRIYKFSGSRNLKSPDNFFINIVIESERGNAMSMALFYMVLASEFNIPVFGVDLVGNFVLAYCDDAVADLSPQEIAQDHVLFYVNPFNRGAVLGKREIDLYLRDRKIDIERQFYLPSTNKTITTRLLKDLKAAYINEGSLHKADEVFFLLKALA